jgi:hypothetical protein
LWIMCLGISLTGSAIVMVADASVSVRAVDGILLSWAAISPNGACCLEFDKGFGERPSGKGVERLRTKSAVSMGLGQDARA